MKRAIDMLGETFGFKEVEHEETVYVLVDFDRVVYVGRTRQLDTRLKQHKRRGINFDAVFYRSFSYDVSDLVEFYLINKLNPKENRADVIREPMPFDKVLKYFHRFTSKEFIGVSLKHFFTQLGLPFGHIYYYSVDDLFNLCLVALQELDTDYHKLDLKFIVDWLEKNNRDDK